MLRIGEYGTQRNGTRLCIHRTTDSINASFHGILRSTGQSQLDAGGLADEIGCRAVTVYQIDDGTFRHRKIGIHLFVVSHRYQWFADVAAYQCAYMPGNHRRHTVHGALYLRTRQLPTGILLLSLGLHQCRLGFQQFVAGGLYTEVAYHTTLLQFQLTVIVHLRS